MRPFGRKSRVFNAFRRCFHACLLPRLPRVRQRAAGGRSSKGLHDEVLRLYAVGGHSGHRSVRCPGNLVPRGFDTSRGSVASPARRGIAATGLRKLVRRRGSRWTGSSGDACPARLCRGSCRAPRTGRPGLLGCTAKACVLGVDSRPARVPRDALPRQAVGPQPPDRDRSHPTPSVSPSRRSLRIPVRRSCFSFIIPSIPRPSGSVVRSLAAMT